MKQDFTMIWLEAAEFKLSKSVDYCSKIYQNYINTLVLKEPEVIQNHGSNCMCFGGRHYVSKQAGRKFSQENKFEQVSSDDHQMSVVGGRISRPGVPLRDRVSRSPVCKDIAKI